MFMLKMPKNFIEVKKMNRREFIVSTAASVSSLFFLGKTGEAKLVADTIKPKTFNRREINNHLRFWYANDPKFANGVDKFVDTILKSVYSPCPTSILWSNYTTMNMNRSFIYEYILIGDVIVHGLNPYRSKILNPDWVEISKNGEFYLIPDENLVKCALYNKAPLPDHVRKLVLNRKNIPLNKNEVIHLRSPMSHWKGNINRSNPYDIIFGYTNSGCSIDDQEYNNALNTIDAIYNVKQGKFPYATNCN